MSKRSHSPVAEAELEEPLEQQQDQPQQQVTLPSAVPPAAAPPAAMPPVVANAALQPVTLGTPPPPLGAAPQTIAQLYPQIGTKGTHFVGPLVSGPTPGNQSAIGVAGSAVLTLPLQVDYSMGNFNMAIQFPSNSLLLWVALVEYQAFSNATPPDIQLGSVSGGTDILAATAPTGVGTTLIENVTGQLPLWTASSPQVPFQAWLGVTGNAGNTAGGMLLLLGFARIPQKWN